MILSNALTLQVADCFAQVYLANLTDEKPLDHCNVSNLIGWLTDERAAFDGDEDPPLPFAAILAVVESGDETLVNDWMERVVAIARTYLTTEEG